MTIRKLIESAKPGIAGAWRVSQVYRVTDENGAILAECEDNATAVRSAVRIGTSTITRVMTLWHYGTAMLTWNADNAHDSSVLDWSLGWGSRSDQNGMNTAFSVLALPYYYSRKGGADILSLNDSGDRKRTPKYLRDFAAAGRADLLPQGWPREAVADGKCEGGCGRTPWLRGSQGARVCSDCANLLGARVHAVQGAQVASAVQAARMAAR